MATGSAARYTAYTGHGSLHQTNVLIKFISSSAGWIYPIDRFFGRAIYEYYYDIDFTKSKLFTIDFTDYAGQEEMQKRNKLLYESYCHLVATLLINVCRDYNIETTEIVRMIALVETKPELLECISQCHFNYIRAVYGIDHFGYLMMQYCNDYMLMCCKDEMRIAEINTSNSQVPNERLSDYMIYLLDVIERIGEKFVSTEEILSGRCLPVVEEMKAGPFISSYGISLSDELQHHEYKSTISTLQEAKNQAKSKSSSPESFPSSTSVKLKSCSSAESFQSSTSMKSKSHSPAESFQSSTSVKSKSHSPAESFQSSTSLKSKSHSSAESFQSSTSVKSKSHSPAESFQSFTSMKSKSHSPAESFQSSTSVKSKSHSPAESFQSSTSMKSKSHSPAEFFQSSTSVKSKSRSPAESFQSSTTVKSKSHSPAESFQSSTSLKSKSHSSAESFQSSTSVKSKSCSSAESSQSSNESMSPYILEVTISSQLAVELMEPSFQPIQYKALETYPDSDRGREEYLLHEYLVHEYDRRLELHISYNAMKFITWNISENMVQLKSVVDRQALFEQTWPSPRSKNEPPSLFRMVYINPITDLEEGIGINKILKEAESLIEQIKQTVNALNS